MSVLMGWDIIYQVYQAQLTIKQKKAPTKLSVKGQKRGHQIMTSHMHMHVSPLPALNASTRKKPDFGAKAQGLERYAF